MGTPVSLEQKLEAHVQRALQAAGCSALTPFELTADMALSIARNFEEHMAPDVEWIDDPRFAKAFQTFIQEIPVPQPEAAFTADAPAYPGYITAKLSPDGTAMVLAVRGDAVPLGVPTASDPLAQRTEVRPGPFSEIAIPLDDWDTFIAQAVRVRWTPAATMAEAMAQPDEPPYPVPHRRDIGD